MINWFIAFVCLLLLLLYLFFLLFCSPIVNCCYYYYYLFISILHLIIQLINKQFFNYLSINALLLIGDCYWRAYYYEWMTIIFIKKRFSSWFKSLIFFYYYYWNYQQSTLSSTISYNFIIFNFMKQKLNLPFHFFLFYSITIHSFIHSFIYWSKKCKQINIAIKLKIIE